MFIKTLVVTMVGRVASLGKAAKRCLGGNSLWGKALVDFLLLPLDALAAYGGLRSSGGKRLEIIFPYTFSGKIMRLKLFGRKPRHTQWADKLAVRDYVKTKVGEQYLSKLLWSGVNLSEAFSQALPTRFVIKANHGSGMNLFVKDKGNFDWTEAGKITQGWLKRDFSVGNGEWQYRWITPRLFIEEFMETSSGDVPIDYKFFCFHGRVEFVQVDFDRFTGHTRGIFDRDFKPLPFGILYEVNNQDKSPPACFAEMLKLAEILADGEPFVRVDLYEIGGRPLFGELTLHPGSGGEKFNPPEWDAKIGALI